MRRSRFLIPTLNFDLTSLHCSVSTQVIVFPRHLPARELASATVWINSCTSCLWVGSLWTFLWQERIDISSSCALRSWRTMCLRSKTSAVTAAAAGILFLLACCCCIVPTAAITFQDNQGGSSLPGSNDAVETAEAQVLGASSLNKACPESCEDIFPLLQPAVRGKVQDVEIQVRGEPKSGTGMMAEWAWDALANVCLYLERLYGKSSCNIAWLTKPDNPSMPGYPHSIVFEPALGKNDSTPPLCPCDSIRV